MSVKERIGLMLPLTIRERKELMKGVESITDECIKWPLSCNGGGYGRISFQNKTLPAHRAVWELANGEIEAGKFICHKCDNKKCINIKHLFVGSASDNMQDWSKKGHNWKRTIPYEIVKKIKNDNSGGYTKLAEKYNVSRSAIAHIKKGRARKFS